MNDNITRPLPQPEVTPKQRKSSKGFMFVVVIITAMLIAGGYFLWQYETDKAYEDGILEGKKLIMNYTSSTGNTFILLEDGLKEVHLCSKVVRDVCNILNVGAP